MTFLQYLTDRKWLFHERGMDAVWESLHKVALSVPNGQGTIGAGDMLTDFGLDQTYEALSQNSGEAGSPAAQYRP